jgi:hypothetical protein
MININKNMQLLKFSPMGMPVFEKRGSKRINLTALKEILPTFFALDNTIVGGTR